MLAVNIVRGLIAAKLTTLGQTVFLQRDQYHALTESELPATLIDKAGVVDITRLEGTAGGAATHLAPIDLTFTATSEAVAEANFNAALTALSDDYSLGGQISEILVLNYGGDENTGKDIFAITLEIRVRFLTPPNDFGTLLT